MTQTRTDTVGDAFAVEVEQTGDRVVVKVSGELDMGTTPDMEHAIPPVARGGHCTLDMREVTFMDSSALHALIGLDVRARAEGWSLAVLHVPGSLVGRLLDRCRVGERIELLCDG